MQRRIKKVVRDGVLLISMTALVLAFVLLVGGSHQTNASSSSFNHVVDIESSFFDMDPIHIDVNFEGIHRDTSEDENDNNEDLDENNENTNEGVSLSSRSFGNGGSMCVNCGGDEIENITGQIFPMGGDPLGAVLGVSTDEDEEMRNTIRLLQRLVSELTETVDLMSALR